MRRLSRAFILMIVVALGACASASDVARRGKALEARLDPVRRSYCPPEALARGLAEVAFAHSASERGDALAAAQHLSRAEVYADEADAAPCRADAGSEPGPVVEPLPDLDHDGIPDVRDPDRDGDGINDTIDQCPTAPEDIDGVDDIDGCPEDDGAPAPEGRD